MTYGPTRKSRLVAHAWVEPLPILIVMPKVYATVKESTGPQSLGRVR